MGLLPPMAPRYRPGLCDVSRRTVSDGSDRHGKVLNMPPISHQTIRLGRGPHSSAEGRACVMELCSMLAGDPFTDHPRCACSVIAAFLRTYSDAVDDARRRDLYRHAAQVVGTVSESDAVRARRAALCREWAATRSRPCWWELRRRRRLRRASRLSDDPAYEEIAEMAANVAAALLRRWDLANHLSALALVDELIAVEQADGRGEVELSLSAADQDWLLAH